MKPSFPYTVELMVREHVRVVEQPPEQEGGEPKRVEQKRVTQHLRVTRLDVDSEIGRVESVLVSNDTDAVKGALDGALAQLAALS